MGLLRDSFATGRHRGRSSINDAYVSRCLARCLARHALSRETISNITDQVVEEMTAWQSRHLDPLYAVLLIDCLVFFYYRGSETRGGSGSRCGWGVRGRRCDFRHSDAGRDLTVYTVATGAQFINTEDDRARIRPIFTAENGEQARAEVTAAQRGDKLVDAR